MLHCWPLGGGQWTGSKNTKWSLRIKVTWTSSIYFYHKTCTYVLSWLDPYPSTVLSIGLCLEQGNWLARCQKWVTEEGNFKDDIWSNEFLVQVDHHGQLCFARAKLARKLKPTLKHPVNVEVYLWAPISKRGAISVIIFKGILTSSQYFSNSETTVLPF